MEDSADLEALYCQAADLEEQGEIEKAREVYERCIELEVNNEHAWIRYAVFLREQEQWREAIEVAEHAVNAKGISSALAFCLIGGCYRDLGQHSDAEQAYRRSIEIQPHDFAWVFLFDALSAQDRDDEAIECLQRALECNPENDEAHYNLGFYYKSQQEDDLAEHHLRRALEIDPDYALAYGELGCVIYNRALNLQVQAEQKNGDLIEVNRLFKEAHILLKRAVELKPDYAWGHIYFACVLDHTRHETEAEKHYREALNLWPNGGPPYWLYGDYLSRQGDYAQGGRLLRRAVELASQDVDDGTTQFFLGRHYQRCRRMYKAKAAFQEAARRGHEKAQKRLDEIERRETTAP